MGFAFILLITLAIATSLIHAQGTDAAAAAEIAAAATSQEPEIFEYMMMYGYNPPRQNDAYCKGFHIDYPANPGLTFEANSHQYIKWSIDEDIYYGDHPPEVVYRARIMSSGQLNYHIIGGDIPLRNEGNTGSVMFPLQVDDVDGLCHYRLMVKHVGIEQNCVYESASFMVVHKPQDRFNGSTVPFFEQNPVYTYSTQSMEALYNATKMT
ncbi:hypothetical protein G6F42_012798 [Rhizopus arrhizus]|nr:hypothetical protein G6F42_012798 [Rhizopus arrhizus]